MMNMENKCKIITICGSLKFKDEMIQVAIQMELEGNVVLTPLFPISNENILTEDEICLLSKIHKEKIKISDAIMVINVNGYIGESTRSEIEYAKILNKEVRYLESNDK